MQQLDLQMNPLPPPPPPTENIFVYSEYDVEVDEFFKDGKWVELPTIIEISMWRFMCEYAEPENGLCHGCSEDKADDLRICMEIPEEGYLQVRFGAPQ